MRLIMFLAAQSLFFLLNCKNKKSGYKKWFIPFLDSRIEKYHILNTDYFLYSAYQ